MAGNRVVTHVASRRTVVTIAVLMVVGMLGVPAAQAQFQVDIPIDTELDEDAGDVVVITTVNVPPESVGEQCSAISSAVNQESTREGNDVLLDSGGTQVVIPNVEAEHDSIIEGQGTLTLGPQIVVSMRLGPEGEFSGGILVSITCEASTPEPGQIIVVKQVTDGSDTAQTFEFTASYDADGFSLADGQQNSSGDLAAGTYSVSETVPAGWSLQSATCDDQSPVDAIELAEGETVTCTFVNDESPTQPGRIIVVKEVVGETSGTPSFDFTASYDADGFSLSPGQQNDSGDLIPGTYSVTENDASGWTLVSASCGNENPDPSNIALGSGQVVTCTFTNQIADSVLAAIEVTVEGSCDVDGGEGVGSVDVTVSVAGGATVVVRDSSGNVEGSFTSDGTIEVEEGATYSWQATPSEGFEFPEGAASSGSITIASCSDPETLPFTGPETDALFIAACALLSAGFSVLYQTRKREE